jgi:hypothetical protein
MYSDHADTMQVDTLSAPPVQHIILTVDHLREAETKLQQLYDSRNQLAQNIARQEGVILWLREMLAVHNNGAV